MLGLARYLLPVVCAKAKAEYGALPDLRHDVFEHTGSIRIQMVLASLSPPGEPVRGNE
jgi:hypothetical protein